MISRRLRRSSRFIKTIGVIGGCLLITSAQAQSIRDHVRLSGPKTTEVSKSQAEDLTLTVTEVATRPIQVWIRTAGVIDKAGKVLKGYVPAANAQWIKAGQRVRAFPPESRSSMFQAKVTRVVQQGNRTMVEATLGSTGRENSSTYVMEIVVDRGEFLSVPNEAIIEEGSKQVVYVQHDAGHYMAHEVKTGLQGELYTEILGGVTAGTHVVTLGSFFIDSEYKLKSTGNSMSDVHQHH